MAQENLWSVIFTDEEVQLVKDNIAAILAVFSDKCLSLTPEERREFGRIDDRTENWSRKVTE